MRLSSNVIHQLAAALNWVIKDGIGQFGGVLYASVVSDRFDSEPKRHRFRAGIFIQLASAMEILLPLFPVAFLVVASASNAGRKPAAYLSANVLDR